MEKVIDAINKAYGLKITEIEKIEYGLWEESFKIRTSSDIYYAKRFWRKDRIKNRYDEMVRGLELSQVLRAKGFPAPELILTKDKKILAHVEDETYEVTEWVEGSTYHPGELPLKGAYSMGSLLGKFHSFFEFNDRYKTLELHNPLESVEKFKSLLLKYETISGEFARMARQVLSEKINILESLSSDFLNSKTIKSRFGNTYNSFWVEQIIYNNKMEVAALIDWTDGAGREGYLADDIDCGLHLSALTKDGIVEFCRGYQELNPMTKEEWEAVINLFIYKHLNDTWIYESWLNKHNRRMEHWEKIASIWDAQIPIRFHQRKEIKESIMKALKLL